MKHKPVTSYIRVIEEAKARTIRAPEAVWEKMDLVAQTLECSVNELVVAMMKKIIEEEM